MRRAGILYATLVLAALAATAASADLPRDVDQMSCRAMTSAPPGALYGQVDPTPQLGCELRKSDDESFRNTHIFIGGIAARWRQVTSIPASSPVRSAARSIGRLALRYRDNYTGEEFSNWCTAWVVSDGHILTNAHCVPMRNRERSGPDPDRTLVAAQLRMNYVELGSETGTVVLEVNPAPVLTNFQLDYAILEFADPTQAGSFPSIFADFEIADQAPPGSPLIIVQHPLAFHQVFDAGCFATTGSLPNADPAPRDSVLYHGCETWSGSSGSPIFAQVGAGLSLVGLHRANNPNRGTLMSAIVADMRANGFAAPSATGGAPAPSSVAVRSLVDDVINFGDDAGADPNDGECDDPRFAGPGVWVSANEARIGHDASDCRELFIAGTVRFLGEAGTPTIYPDVAIRFGDDLGPWPNDGECDDDRFEGPGAAYLGAESRYGDATDCRMLYEADEVRLRN